MTNVVIHIENILTDRERTLLGQVVQDAFGEFISARHHYYRPDLSPEQAQAVYVENRYIDATESFRKAKIVELSERIALATLLRRGVVTIAEDVSAKNVGDAVSQLGKDDMGDMAELVDEVRVSLLFGTEMEDVSPLAEQHFLSAIADLMRAVAGLRLAALVEAREGEAAK